MMAELGHAPSVVTFARHYQGLAQGIIIDVCDRAAAEDIVELGFQVVATHTVMSTTTDRLALARAALDLAQSLGGSREPITERAIT